MRVFDETVADVHRLISMVLHRDALSPQTTAGDVAVATYAAVSARIQVLGVAPDRVWVLSIAHGLARAAIAHTSRAPHGRRRTVA